MDKLTLEDIREERCWDIISNMDPEDLSQYAMDFIFGYEDTRKRFVAEVLSDFDDEGDEYYESEDDE